MIYSQALRANGSDTGVIRAAAREASGALRLAQGERTFLVQPQRRRGTPSTGSGRTGVIRA